MSSPTPFSKFDIGLHALVVVAAAPAVVCFSIFLMVILFLFLGPGKAAMIKEEILFVDQRMPTYCSEMWDLN